ncbi:MAG: amino acid ABC transporter substrate-binding protein [Deltaproteobacteria bacterium]|nr:amino acid ABC transporter substrate-binding protein [Deltaproteobacteria bacterium]
MKYGFFPWARSFEYAKHGDWDGTVAWAKKKDRIPFFYFSGWLIKDSAELFHLKSFKFQWTIGDFKTLKGVEIGATIGYNYGTSFQKEEKSGIIFVERVPSDEINFRKLLEGRIDVFPISLEVGYSILNRNFSKQEISLITHSPWGSVVDTNTDNNKYYLMFSKKVKKNKKLLMLFNKGLKRLRESGKYDQYFEESRREDYHQEIEKAYKVE